MSLDKISFSKIIFGSREIQLLAHLSYREVGLFERIWETMSFICSVLKIEHQERSNKFILWQHTENSKFAINR